MDNASSIDRTVYQKLPDRASGVVVAAASAPHEDTGDYSQVAPLRPKCGSAPAQINVLRPVDKSVRFYLASTEELIDNLK